MNDPAVKGAGDARGTHGQGRAVKSLPTRPTIFTIPQEQGRADWNLMRGRASIKRWVNLAVVGSQLVFDATMIVIAFITAYRLRARIDIFSTFVAPSRTTYEIMLVVMVLTLLVSLNFFGLYSLRRGVSRIDQFYRVSSAVSVGLGASLALNSFLLGNSFIYSRQMLLIGWVLCIALVTLGRFAHGTAVGLLRRRIVARDRLLIVGTGSTGQHVLETIARSPWLGYEIVGVLGRAGAASTGERAATAPHAEVAPHDDVPLLGDDSQLAEVVARHNIDEVIIALNSTPHEDVLALTQTLIEAR